MTGPRSSSPTCRAATANRCCTSTGAADAAADRRARRRASRRRPRRPSARIRAGRHRGSCPCRTRRHRRKRTAARRAVPRGPGEALLAREQLDVPPAAAAHHRALREVPDLLRRLPHLRGQRRRKLYRPTYRSEVLRRLYFQHVKGGGLISAWQHGTVELNWPLVARLAELAYRCNLCRRCAQTCPVGVDNGLVAHEIRKLFSQEMGIAPKELHASGLDAPARSPARPPA